ncbi:MAG: glycosyltransferase family 4 protein, partial [Nitrospirota bacterium]
PGSIEKLSVVHNGVEWDEFEAPFLKGQENKRAILRDMSLDDGKFYFLYLGSGYERKGASKAINAMKYLPYDTRLLIVGKDKHEMKYRRLADKLGLDARVQFFGPQKNVLPFFQVSDAFVLPTLYDPFSNATLESLAMGLYAITSNANGCVEVIKDGAGTVIADLSEVGSVADAMKLALTDRLTKQEIRDSVKHLTFQDQLNKIVDKTISQK